MKNPYNFSFPVKDIELLFGRTRELNEIRYFLDQGLQNSSPISIALIGDRASGKTSLINATESTANSLGYLTVRIDLNESDVISDAHFFLKLIDSLINAVLETGGFEGYNGSFYREYLEIMSGLNPEIKYVPLMSPRILHGVTSERTVYVNDNIIIKDLNEIRKQADSNILILIDEANLLSKNLNILQMLRNIMIRIDNFSILLAGTESIFPSIDEVFSPIARQFVKIEVGPFKDLVDSIDCIIRPLEINDETRKILVSEHTLKEIHEISSGKPYEIQFISYNLFKKMHDDKSSEMKLNTESMNSILNQMTSLSTGGSNKIISQLSTMNAPSLRLLRVLDNYINGVSLDILRAHMHVFHRLGVDDFKVIESDLESFENTGIIKSDGESISFAGNAFERVYLKYISKLDSKSYKTPSIADNVWYKEIIELLIGKDNPNFIYFINHSPSGVLEDIDRIIKNINLSKGSQISTPNDFEILSNIYRPAFHFREGESPIFIVLRFIMKDIAFNIIMIQQGSSQQNINLLESKFDTLRRDVNRIGGKIYFEKKRFLLPKRDKIIQAVKYIGDRRFINDIAYIHDRIIFEFHSNPTIDQVTKTKNLHINSVMEYAPFLEGDYNNLGYVLINIGQYKDAETILTRSFITLDVRDNFRRSLVGYNLALACYMSGNYQLATEYIDSVQDIVKGIAKNRRICACLLKPCGDKVEEVTDNPDLGEFSENLAKILSSVNSAS